ncbi:MAG: S46 family peptidase [Alistipes sp.]|nr:S46 family peptidase [Alistipes sp.]
MKRSILAVLCTLALLPAAADEGMWLPSLIAPRIKDMRAKGFRLTAEDIYSVNRASMKDAVVLFGGGCTGELVSAEGLLLTNHHCGYGAIQRHSGIGHDYLTDGFWARSREEELPNEGLWVRFLVRMDDVTERLSAGETAQEIIAEATDGGRYKAAVERMYYGNQSFLFVYEQYDDVRLVAAPPSSIGNFGSDTDNWIWPRHTGDFSVFRIYADRDNRPAKYSPDNVPYRPKRYFPVSTKGVREGDFTMIYGFPGNTQQFVTADAVNYVQNISDPAKIDIRTKRLAIIKAAQQSDPALRIHYAAQHAGVANAWKKWQGEVLGLSRRGTADKKRDYERRFTEWAAGTQYQDVTAELREEHLRIIPVYFAREILNETLRALPIPYSARALEHPLFERCIPTEQALFRMMFAEYERHIGSSEYAVGEFRRGVERYGSAEAYADRIFELARTDAVNEEIKTLVDGIADNEAALRKELGTAALRNLNSARLDELYARYLRGLREFDRKRAFFPDANLTLRVAYGTVAGYEYADGEYHKPQTTLAGILAKDNPEVYDYNVPQRLRDICAAGDYGRWGVEIDGRKTVPVCFLATNHTTGGNSGSPIINGRGEIIGINFDRTWRSTMSDLEFDPAICRNISVDIRYVLFIIDKVGGAGYLIDEMDLR